MLVLMVNLLAKVRARLHYVLAVEKGPSGGPVVASGTHRGWPMGRLLITSSRL
jgi:hypothetical protein